MKVRSNMKLWWYLFQQLWDGQDSLCNGNLLHVGLQADKIKLMDPPGMAGR